MSKSYCCVNQHCRTHSCSFSFYCTINALHVHRDKLGLYIFPCIGYEIDRLSDTKILVSIFFSKEYIDQGKNRKKNHCLYTHDLWSNLADFKLNFCQAKIIGLDYISCKRVFTLQIPCKDVLLRLVDLT